ncbi:hypothetical protein Lal_00006751 [Lupinus albus]|nr:hypothetical protein Lal_00006751 [Lupinus albus]
MSSKGGSQVQGQRTLHPIASFTNLPGSRSQIKNTILKDIFKNFTNSGQYISIMNRNSSTLRNHKAGAKNTPAQVYSLRRVVICCRHIGHEDNVMPHSLQV